MVQPDDGSDLISGARQRLGKVGDSLKNWVHKQLQRSPQQSEGPPASNSEMTARCTLQSTTDRSHGAISDLPPFLLLCKVRIGQVHSLPHLEHFASLMTSFNSNLVWTIFHLVTCYCPRVNNCDLCSLGCFCKETVRQRAYQVLECTMSFNHPVSIFLS
jgi:hypothetical protein